VTKGAAIVVFKISEGTDEKTLQEFNEWYDEYISRELKRVPEFESGTRFVSGTGKRIYSTYYTISNVDEIPAAYAHNYSEAAKPDLDAWKYWVDRGVLTDVTFDFFKPIFTKNSER